MGCGASSAAQVQECQRQVAEAKEESKRYKDEITASNRHLHEEVIALQLKLEEVRREAQQAKELAEHMQRAGIEDSLQPNSLGWHAKGGEEKVEASVAQDFDRSKEAQDGDQNGAVHDSNATMIEITPSGDFVTLEPSGM